MSFKLRSGSGSLNSHSGLKFKELGSSPAKQTTEVKTDPTLTHEEREQIRIREKDEQRKQEQKQLFNERLTNEQKTKIDEANRIDMNDPRYKENVADANTISRKNPNWKATLDRGEEGDKTRQAIIDAAVDSKTGFLIDPDNKEANQLAGTARFQQAVTDTHRKTKKELLKDAGKKTHLLNQVFGPSKKKLKHAEIKDAKQQQLAGFPVKPIERKVLHQMEEKGDVYSGVSKGKGDDK